MKSTEKAYLSEEERKKAKINDEAELKKEQEAILKLEKKKEVIREEEAISDDLQRLRDLLEEHIIDDSLVNKVIEDAELDHEEIEKIFDQIDAIEKIDNIDDYLPRDMRVTKEEYAAATHDDTQLTIVEAKIHTALTRLATAVTPQNAWSMNLFSGFLTMLDKNLITIQEHHIDMRDWLIKPWSQKSQSIWQTIKESFKK